MAERDFLSFLVDETFKLHQSRELELSSLESKLNDYGLSFLKGEFIPQIQSIRFITPFGKIDFPINWSAFDLESTTATGILISNDNDSDHLLQILKTAWNKNIEKVLLTHADGFCYFVGLKPGEEVHLHDLLNPQELIRAA